MNVTLIITFVVFGICMFFLGIGVIFGRKCLRGSCQSSNPVIGPDGEKLVCPRCEKEIESQKNQS